ncbi:unnamed protein product [Closterium sp. Yama58-4]|nr:unnamed protein product [Closterium sp. Yama58-4]
MSEAAQAAASDPPTSIASPTSLPSEAIRPARRFSKAPDFWLLSPLLYAPLLPLIRISLRHKPQLRDRLFATAVGGAFMHGAWLSHRFYNAESYTQAHNR